MHIRIYQINPKRDDNHLLGLNSMQISRKFGSFIVLSGYYDLVFDDVMPIADSGDVVESIHNIMRFFDHSIPNGYRGINIISSDVIEVVETNNIGRSTFYFIDGLEVRALESFNANATINTIKNRNVNMLDPYKYHPGNMEE